VRAYSRLRRADLFDQPLGSRRCSARPYAAATRSL
jgi:hypothetical protein